MNIYNAHERRDDAEVYDAISTSIEGDLLREVYLHAKRSLIMAEQDGASSHLKHLEVVDIKASGSGKATAYEVTWQLSAETEHWDTCICEPVSIAAS